MVTAAPTPPLSKITNLQDYSSQFFRSLCLSWTPTPGRWPRPSTGSQRLLGAPPLRPWLRLRADTRSVGGAGRGSRAVIGGVRATGATLWPPGRSRVTEKQNGWNPFAPSSDT